MSDDLVKRAGHNALSDMSHYASVELIEALADRIEELEAKLAKAVDFIQDLTGCEWPYDEGAKRTLAELTGGKDVALSRHTSDTSQ